MSVIDPATLATVDQMYTAACRDIDALIPQAAARIREHGPEVAHTELTGLVHEALSGEAWWLAALAAAALVRLAQQQTEEHEVSWTKAVQAPYGVGTCRGCGRRFTLTQGGGIRRHGPQGQQPCPGSGREPKARGVETVRTVLDAPEVTP